MLKHAENTMAANPKTLDFSRRSEFLVATGGGTTALGLPDALSDAAP
jgi:hypothetical protein